MRPVLLPLFSISTLQAATGCREISLSGSGTHTRLFDGNSLFLLEEGDEECMRPKLSLKEPAPEPRMYGISDLDWRKAVVLSSYLVELVSAVRTVRHWISSMQNTVTRTS